MDEIERMTLRLYRQMPGAPSIPRQDGQEMFGDVMGNEHWSFCLEIARMMVACAQAYAR